MNCEEVQNQLLDLLDKSLDSGRAQEIEDHLAACSLCTKELASLTECHRLVSGLPVVEPPVGFTTRVMAEVRGVAHSPGLWERLFLPLQIKMPLHATAVVLIGVLAAYIYQKEPLQRESGMIVQPATKKDETAKLAPSVAQAPAADSNTTKIEEQAKTRVQKFKDISRSKDQIRSPATLSPAPLQEKSSAASESASSRPGRSLSSEKTQAKGTLAAAPQPETENASKDTAATGKSLLSPEARERSAASSLDALRSSGVVVGAMPADHKLAIRLKEPLRDEKVMEDRFSSDRAQAERRSLTQEEAKNLEQAREQTLQTGQSQTVRVTIARNQYELFKKELTDLGNIELESFTPDPKIDSIAKSSDRLRIEVMILPPLASGNSEPPQPSSR
jgi:hypothetical protein